MKIENLERAIEIKKQLEKIEKKIETLSNLDKCKNWSMGIEIQYQFNGPISTTVGSMNLDTLDMKSYIITQNLLASINSKNKLLDELKTL